MIFLWIMAIKIAFTDIREKKIKNHDLSLILVVSILHHNIHQYRYALLVLVFGFFLLKITSAHLNGGFAKAADYTGSNIVTDLSQAGELIEIEPQALAHMNEDHPQSIRLYATKLAGEKDGAWRVSGSEVPRRTSRPQGH